MVARPVFDVIMPHCPEWLYSGILENDILPRFLDITFDVEMVARRVAHRYTKSFVFANGGSLCHALSGM